LVGGQEKVTAQRQSIPAFVSVLPCVHSDEEKGAGRGLDFEFVLEKLRNVALALSPSPIQSYTKRLSLRRVSYCSCEYSCQSSMFE
jgi:hypothetical protein